MIIIRKAGLKDIPIIVKLWKEFLKYHDELLMKRNPKLNPYLVKKKTATNSFRKFIKRNIRSKNAVLYIAEVGEKPAGYCLVYIKNNIPIFKLEKIGHISDLFVKQEYRKQGISSKFKNEAIKWLKKKRIKHISLQVYKDNDFAHSIYGKWGFDDYHIEMRRKT